jgi:hypothetical protein
MDLIRTSILRSFLIDTHSLLHSQSRNEDVFNMFRDMADRENGHQGKDVNVKLRLTFLEAVNGCTKEVKYDVGTTTKTKRGRPKVDSKTRTVDVKIPAGVDSVSTDRQTDRKADRRHHTNCVRQTASDRRQTASDRQADRQHQTDRKTDRKADNISQTDRQTDKQANRSKD